MARYRLFKNGSPVESLDIPAFIPYVPITKPVYPLYGPQAYEAKLRQGMTEMELAVYRQIWNDYTLAVRAYGVYIKTAAENYKKQFTDFAQVLESNYQFYTGTYNRSTKQWSWALLPGVQYSFIQASEKLIKYTGNVTDFLINGYFGW
jgi:hypothetical protein